MGKHKHSKKLNACKFCGKDISGAYERNPKARRYCGKECRESAQADRKVLVSCCVCGKKIERYKSRLEIRSKFACSVECQMRHALEDNRGKPHGEPDWLLRSAKAKSRWKLSESRRRRSCNVWIQSIGKRLSRVLPAPIDINSWEYRVALRIRTFAGRKQRKRVSHDSSRTVEQAIRKVRQKRKLFELSDWEKKVGYKLSSHKARRSWKENAQKHKQVEGFSSHCQDKGKWIQVCFEWVGD